MNQNAIGLMLKCCSVRAVSLFALFDVTTLKKTGREKINGKNTTTPSPIRSLVSFPLSSRQ